MVWVVQRAMAHMLVRMPVKVQAESGEQDRAEVQVEVRAMVHEPWVLQGLTLLTHPYASSFGLQHPGATLPGCACCALELLEPGDSRRRALPLRRERAWSLQHPVATTAGLACSSLGSGGSRRSGERARAWNLQHPIATTAGCASE